MKQNKICNYFKYYKMLYDTIKKKKGIIQIRTYNYFM